MTANYLWVFNRKESTKTVMNILILIKTLINTEEIFKVSSHQSQVKMLKAEFTVFVQVIVSVLIS